MNKPRFLLILLNFLGFFMKMNGCNFCSFSTAWCAVTVKSKDKAVALALFPLLCINV